MRDDVTSTYSVVGRGAAVAHVTADMTPVVDGLARVEAAMREWAPRFHVPVPLIHVDVPEQAPATIHVEAPHVTVQAPLVTVNVPEPHVTINVPETVTAPFRIEAPRAEVTVVIPSLRVLVVANVIALSMMIALGIFSLITYLHSHEAW